MFGCEKNDPILLEDVNYIAFSVRTATLNEDGASISVELYSVTANNDRAECTLSVSTSGIDAPATEGEDFSISSTNVVFENGYGNAKINISPIDNDKADGTRQFYIEITSATAGFDLGIDGKEKLLVTIVDDEHPLKNFEGSYYSECTPIWWGSYWWNSAVKVDPNDPNGLLISAFGWSKQPYGDFVVKATVDIDAETITIAAGPTQIAEAYGNGYYHAFCVGDPATMGPDGSNNYGKPLEVPLVGTYTTNTDGKYVFAFQNWGVKWMAPDGTYDGDWWWEFVSSSTMTQE